MKIYFGFIIFLVVFLSNNLFAQLASTGKNKSAYTTFKNAEKKFKEAAEEYSVLSDDNKKAQYDRFGHNQVSRSLPNYNFELKTSAEKYEYAGLIYGAVAQLNTALGYIDQGGLSRIEAHTVALAQALRNGIAKLGYSMFTPANNPSCITSFDHGLDPELIRRVLDEENISVSFREKETQIRASVGMFNNQDDIDHFLQVLSRLA